MKRLSIPKISAKPLAPPKLTKLTVHKTGNGLLVTHHFLTAKSKQFSFENPKKLLTHLRRTVDTEWLHPNVDTEANRIEGELNI